ncbi:magnesium transporter CorA family protein [Terriglobus roseus]|uniref:Magnesium transport protein CorA n=1 Tax=Terriglobus roseus TaxID=392734 RepID=A0A1H4RPT5_9BACT|nr:magnesium transporter CorA family protein [Terriglobus roseus]SEC33910.1 magnesium transporter [Terriglobus roseus]
MLTTYSDLNGHLTPTAEGDLRNALWIDLYEPSREEEIRVEAMLQLEIPTRDEMREVESSSALYREHGATFVTIRLVERGASPQPRLASVTLVLAGQQFVTIRYADPKAFQLFTAKAQKPESVLKTALSAMMCLLETVVDRDADLLEEIGDALDPISLEIFSQNAVSMDKIAAADLGGVLKRIGNAGELASRVRESLHSIGRSIPFLQMQMVDDSALQTRLKTLSTDVQSLLEHDNFLQTQIQFLLDSSIGLISIQQNAIMKTLSVAAVVFLPPTLIGSIYGMNFERMPELHWHYGYLWALGLMAMSACGPLLFFRLKRWL